MRRSAATTFGQSNPHPGLWAAGNAGSLTHAGGVPVDLHLPHNGRDWDDIPEEAQKGLEFVWLETVDQAIETALAERVETVEVS